MPSKTLFLQRVCVLILCLGLHLGLHAQNLSGKVVDSDNLELIGASVSVNQGKSGTITDIDGRYSLQHLKKGDQIVFSYIGMVSKTFKYKGEKTLNVTLSSDTELLEEVVVVGFGQQKKESVVGSVTQAKGEDLLRAGNVTTVSEALTGILPGVSTMQAAGQPGSTGATLLIRGQSTWGDNTPLYMVDGVEREFNDIDPNEIESISVLKDASATAVYGVKAANGVILITTKKGVKQQTRISFSANYSFKNPTVDTDYISDYPSTLRYYNEASRNDNRYDMLFTDREIAMWENPNRNMDNYSYTRFINEMLKTGYSQAYNVNLTGGNDKVTFFTSLGYNYDGDIFDINKQTEYDPRTYQRRYNWRSNVDYNITKSTKFSVKLAGDIIDWNGNPTTAAGKGNGISDGGSQLQRLYNTVMIGAPSVYSNGLFGLEEGEFTSTKNIRVNMENFGSNSRRSNRLFSDFILSQKIGKHFTLKGKLSYNQYTQYTSKITDEPLFYYPPNEFGIYELVNPDKMPGDPKVYAEKIGNYNKSLYYEFSAAYAQKFGKHDVSALGIFNRRRYQNKVDFPYLEESWIARATYGYDKRYLAEFNGAYNGSENFAPGQRFGFFPSMAVGWVLSEEKFMKKNLSAIEFLKFRYSYGLVGSDRGAGRYTYLSTYGSLWSNMYFGNPPVGLGTIYKEGDPANLNATWETAVKQNLGVESTFLKGRLRVAVDLFDEHRDGILMQYQTLPSWYGAKAPSGNIGETKNHGIDIELRWDDKIGKDFYYWATANMSMSENRVVFRDDPAPKPEYKKAAGKPIGYKSGLVDYGLYQTWDDVYNYPASSFNGALMPGDLIFMDYDGNGLVDRDDFVPIADPSYASNTYAFSLGFQYKGFSVSGMFNGMFGMSKYVSGAYLWEWDTMSSLGFVMNDNEKMDAWRTDNVDGTHPILHTMRGNHNDQTSTYNTRSSSFLRLRNLELKYRFSKDLCTRIGLLKNFEVYVNGQNLFTWSALPDIFDPEANRLEVYPITKRYNVGLRCTL